MNKSEQFQISPYCIYHYSDRQTNTFYGYIGNPTKIRTQNGNTELKCVPNNTQHSNWVLYSSFYAFSPMIRPIPNGLKLINVIKVGQKPYEKKSVEHGYDPFDIQKNTVSFLTWNKPVFNSVPLYIHITPNGDSFPSFEKNPPHNGLGWTQAEISPIFVLVDPEFSGITVDSNGVKIYTYPKDKNGIPIFKFIINDNMCVPSNKGTSLDKCFLLTDEDLLGTDIYKPRTLLEELTVINKKKQHEELLKNFFSKLPTFIIILFIVIFLISLISCIILLSR